MPHHTHESMVKFFKGLDRHDQAAEFERQQDLSEALIRKAEKENATNPFDEMGEMDYPDTGIENFDGEDVPLHSK